MDGKTLIVAVAMLGSAIYLVAQARMLLRSCSTKARAVAAIPLLWMVPFCVQFLTEGDHDRFYDIATAIALCACTLPYLLIVFVITSKPPTSPE